MKQLVLIASVLLASLEMKASHHLVALRVKKIIDMSVDEKGKIYIGRDTLTSDQLVEELKIRLWKSYMGTGKMYDGIKVEYTGNPSSSVKETTKKSIHEAQQKTLIDVCLQKHKKLYEDLSSRQQQKIRKEFPVLFQKI